MTNKRIFVKKRNGYNKEELQLRDNLNLEFNLGLDSVELYVIYDVFNIDEETYELAKTSVFSEIVVDEVFEDIELNDGKYFAYEVLPAQYDQRADSAKESIRLLNSKSKATVRSGKLVLFNKELTDEQLELVESYLVNPIEARKKDLSILDFTLDSTPKPLKDLAGFLEFDKDSLLGLKKEFSLAMNIEDLVFIQDYFKKEGRVPTETEIYVLDCYWSDHCRHTTFETVLDEVKIESELFQKEMQDAFDYYLNVRDELDRNDKPITLMDMASIIGKYHVGILKDENIDLIKDYMKFQKIAGSSSVLNDELGKRYFEFYGKYLNGQKERETLEKRALYFVDGTLGELVGKEYVKKNFSPEAKKNTQEMVSYIKKAFQNRINKLDWMSAETKKKAIQKLNKINVKIGYPDKWHDYSTLNINENDSLYDQMVKAGEWAYDKEFKKIGKPVDKTEWFMDAHTVNAYYSPTGNEIVFPAGILQKPFYDFKNSEVGSNFGGIGAVIGHEITHGFDVSGAQFDGDGNVKNWWTAQDKQKFDAATKKLEDEFSNYTVGDNIKLNGKYTLTENIADLGGVNIAYDALQLYLADHPDLKVSNDTENELFFLNYANIWKQKATQEYRNNLAKTDSHSPNFLRVNSVLKNTDAFHKIFKTKPGDKMYRAPQDRVKIW